MANFEVSFPPGSAEFPSSNPASPDIRGTGRPCLDYDPTTDETAYWHFRLPSNYAGGGLSLTIYWASTSAVTGDVKWDAGVERLQDDVDDIDADSFAAVQSVTATTASVSGELSYDTITFTDGAQMDSLAAGELGRLKITRNAASGSDTMTTSDAELVFAVLTET